MLHRFLMWGAILATSGALVTGCGSAPPKGGSGSAIKRERAADAAVERRAEAHAHYAAGVIREMNNEQQAATDE
jgi:hypothetical protein